MNKTLAAAAAAASESHEVGKGCNSLLLEAGCTIAGTVVASLNSKSDPDCYPHSHFLAAPAPATDVYSGPRHLASSGCDWASSKYLGRVVAAALDKCWSVVRPVFG